MEVPVEKVIEVPVEKIVEQRVEVPVYQEKIVYRDRETPLVHREVEVVEVEKVREPSQGTRSAGPRPWSPRE